MTENDLRTRCQNIMLQLDTHDQNAALNAGDRLARLLVELMAEVAKDLKENPGGRK